MIGGVFSTKQYVVVSPTLSTRAHRTFMLFGHFAQTGYAYMHLLLDFLPFIFRLLPICCTEKKAAVAVLFSTSNWASSLLLLWLGVSFIWILSSAIHLFRRHGTKYLFFILSCNIFLFDILCLFFTKFGEMKSLIPKSYDST
jgi:hypothetical protein